MSRILNGLVAGFVATVVTSLVLVVGARTELLTRVDPVTDLVTLANKFGFGPVTPPIGWALHFALGTVVLGIVYALIRGLLPRGPVAAGVIYGTLIWSVGVVFVQPQVGVGLIAKGMEAGLTESAAALLVDVIFGVVLGIVYANLRSSAATRDVVPG